MLEVTELEGALRADALLSSLPKLGNCSILFEVADSRLLVDVGREVRVEGEPGINETWDFSVRIPLDAWVKFDSPVPPPGYTTAQAIVALLGDQIIDGDRRKWAQYTAVVERVLTVLRGSCGTPAEGPGLPAESQTVGRYVRLEVEGVGYRVFYEHAGDGIPLVCLHTAGSDARQYRFLLEDRAITSSFRVLAFDLPWHGRSSPPDGWRSASYRLRTDWYAQVIRAFCQALDLEGPVLLGCSMGGSVGLYMGSVFGDEFRAVCSLEGGFGNPRRFVDWTRHTEVDHALFLSTWVSGLMSPRSPSDLCDQIVWEYSQSAPGVYNGDTYFVAADLPSRSAELGPSRCPLYVFSGEYDYSSTPEMSRSAAEQLRGRFIPMPGMEHFPMCEDPERFKDYLAPVLDEIRAFDDSPATEARRS